MVVAAPLSLIRSSQEGPAVGKSQSAGCDSSSSGLPPRALPLTSEEERRQDEREERAKDEGSFCALCFLIVGWSFAFSTRGPFPIIAPSPPPPLALLPPSPLAFTIASARSAGPCSSAPARRGSAPTRRAGEAAWRCGTAPLCGRPSAGRGAAAVAARRRSRTGEEVGEGGRRTRGGAAAAAASERRRRGGEAEGAACGRRRGEGEEAAASARICAGGEVGGACGRRWPEAEGRS